MSLTPFLNAPIIIQVHSLCAILALVIGPFALFRRRRDRIHRWAGRIWAASMLATALSAAFIFEIRLMGPFSPIHLLIPLVFVGVWRGIALIRRGDVVGHGKQMRSLYFTSIGLAGLFTLLPDRLISTMLAPEHPWLGFAVGSLILVWGSWRAWKGRIGTRLAAV